MFLRLLRHPPSRRSRCHQRICSILSQFAASLSPLARHCGRALTSFDAENRCSFSLRKCPSTVLQGTFSDRKGMPHLLLKTFSNRKVPLILLHETFSE